MGRVWDLALPLGCGVCTVPGGLRSFDRSKGPSRRLSLVTWRHRSERWPGPAVGMNSIMPGMEDDDAGIQV